MAMKESTKKMIKYLQSHSKMDLTAEDVANAIGSTAKAVGAAFTTAVANKNLGEREEDPEKTRPDGKPIKYLRLNKDGLRFDVDAEPDLKKKKESD